MANATNGEDDPVIEGEFIEADDTAPETTADNRATRPNDTPRSGFQRAIRWLPWVLLSIALVFIGGLFAAPALEQHLVAYGLMSPRAPALPPATGQDSTDRHDNSHNALRLDDLELTLAAVGHRLKTFEAALAALNEDSAEIKSRLATMGTQPIPPEQGGTDSASYESRLSALRERLDSLQAVVNTDLTNERHARSTLSDKLATVQSEQQRLVLDIDSLSGRLRQLEQPDPQARLTVTPGIFPAILALGRHLENGTAYDKTMPSLQDWFTNRPDAENALETLSLYAADGIPTLPALRRDLDLLLPAIRQAERAGQAAQQAAQEDETLFSGLKDKLTSIIVIHPKNSEASDNLSEQLVSAQRALEEGHLEDAITNLESLSPDIRAPADKWLEAAHARMAATGAFHDLLTLLQENQTSSDTQDARQRQTQP